MKKYNFIKQLKELPKQSQRRFAPNAGTLQANIQEGQLQAV